MIRAFFMLCFWYAVAFCIASLVGCSASEAISKGAAEIRKSANAIHDEALGARSDLNANNIDGVAKHLDAIDLHASAIEKTTDLVQQKVAGVQDRTPAWLSTIRLALFAVVLIAVVFVMWRLNVFLFLESAIQVLATLLHRVFGRAVGAT